MNRVYVVIKEDLVNDLTTVEKVFGDSLFNDGYKKAIRYATEYARLGVEYHIEEMAVH